jgi:transposase
MPRQQHNQKPLPTIWRVPDALWSVIEQVLAELDPPARTGRKRIDARSALDAIIFRLRSGCQWNRLPKESPTIALSIARFSAGYAWECSITFGPCSSKPVKIWVDATGSSRQPTPPWVRPGLGVT